MNSTTYAKRTEHKPIDILFRGVMDAKSKTKKVAFVDAFQVLNDSYLGRMSVSNYFAIAENSVRINELNIIAIEELKNYHLVMKENYHIPDKVVYGLPISTSFLYNDKDFDILLSTLKKNNYKKGSVVLSFNGATLEGLDDAAKKRYIRLRRAGYKTAVAQFGEYYNSIDIFANFTFDYLRCEAQYFDATPNKKNLLTMLIRFCNANKIGIIMEGVDSSGQLTRFKRAGVKFVTGNAVSPLSQFVTNEFLCLPNLQDEKLAAYMQKLQKELDVIQREELAELDGYRKVAFEKAKNVDVNNVIPTAPRPELEKSPYQIRLEQQRKAAMTAVQAIVAQTQAEENEEESVADVGALNDEETQTVQAVENTAETSELTEATEAGQEDEQALEVTETADAAEEPQADEHTAEATEAMETAEEVENAAEENETAEVTQDVEQTADEAEADNGVDEISVDSDGKAFVSEEESGISAPVRPNAPEKKVDKRKKRVKADFENHAKLLDEYRSSVMFGGFGFGSGMEGIGVTLHIDSDDEDTPPLEGSYNEKGQWVDEDGNVFNGYFDIDGNWIEYEQYDSTVEGSYNDFGQWVDVDGRVYDGYFDEQGRWIDYTYTDSNGEIVDNGYFDDKIGKWVPFGYFAEDGSYHRF